MTSSVKAGTQNQLWKGRLCDLFSAHYFQMGNKEFLDVTCDWSLVAAAEHVAQAIRLVNNIVDAHVVLAAVVVQRHAPGAVHYVLLVGVPGAQFRIGV